MRHTDQPDAFDAIADPSRRAILELLGRGESSVSVIVRQTKLSQAMVSKHLRMLRDTGLVQARSDGTQRIYRINVKALRDVHRWVTRFERLWGHASPEDNVR